MIQERTLVEIKSPSSVTRLVDRILWPIMFLLGGATRGSTQETHYWHCQPVDPITIEPSLSAQVVGDEVSNVASNRVFPFPFFHAPLLGGWRNYVVLQVQASVEYWHVGWIHRSSPVNSRPKNHVQRLKISSREIKVLGQAMGFVTDFFAIGPKGEQLPLKVTGQGVLGDGRYSTLRLF